MHQQVGNHVIYMMSPPDAKDIITLNRLKCKHSSKLVDCRVDHNSNLQEASHAVSNPKPALKSTVTKEQPAKSVAVQEPVLPSADIRENPDALKNTRAVDTVFIGGETLAEMKEELESNFQDISLTASVHRADLLEDMPEVLKRIADGRHPNDVASIRVVLVPLRSSKDSQKDIETSVAETVVSCMSILAKFCAKKHLSRLRADTGHSCAVETLQPPKVPALSATTQLLGKIKNNNLISHLENEANKTRSIHSALGRFKQFRRMNCYSTKENCYVNPKDDNYLRNFKTINGERGTLENLKGLLFLEGNLRRNFTSFIVGIAATRFSELKLAANYKFLMENGLSVVPPEDLDKKAKRARSSSSHRSKTSKHRRNNMEGSDEGDLRDRLDCDKVCGQR